MFKAIVTEQLISVLPTGQTVPAAQEKRALIGNMFADRESAVKACDTHFTVLKSELQRRVHDNALIGQSTLSWNGNCGTPEIPLGIRGYDNPPPQVYEVPYTVSQAA